jgi:RimK family alpha-L-glutamate ligase
MCRVRILGTDTRDDRFASALLIFRRFSDVLHGALSDGWSDLFSSNEQERAMLRQHTALDAHQASLSSYAVAKGVRRAFVVGGESATNVALVKALTAYGCHGEISTARGALSATVGDVILNRLDVLPSLDGVEQGFWSMARTERTGALLLNRAGPLLNAHDKLATALLLARADIPQPRSAHVREVDVPGTLQPPFVVKPRFGSWGRDVFRCESLVDLRLQLERLAHRHWFRRQGALVQELIAPTGRDLRLLVAAGRVIGAIERVALPGEWRTNVALGAYRRPAEPPLKARLLALRAVDALGLDLAGVDLLIDEDGNYLVLEVNGAVDFTVEYLLEADAFLAVAEALLVSPTPAVAFAV